MSTKPCPEDLEICESFAEAWEREQRPAGETEALAIVLSQVKAGQRRTKGLWEVAIAVDFLVDLYGGRRQVAETTGLSYETVRDYHHLLELPGLVKMMLG